MDNWDALQKCLAALDLIEAAVNRWGRDNLLDWPTKLGIIVQKTDSTTLGYVVEALYTRMWRMANKDPYSCAHLGDVILELLWVKSYVTFVVRKYPEAFTACCNSEASMTEATSTAAG